MIRGDVADLRIRRRLAQIADRLGELRARSHEASEPSPAPEVDRERVLRAIGNARLARAHAAEAALLALTAYIRSAEVHDRVAGLYDQLAASGAGDTARYQRQAEQHRMSAAKDRMLAARDRNGAASQREGAATVASGQDHPARG